MIVNNKKKYLSMVLTIAMVLSMVMPMSAFAAAPVADSTTPFAWDTNSTPGDDQLSDGDKFLLKFSEEMNDPTAAIKGAVVSALQGVNAGVTADDITVANAAADNKTYDVTYNSSGHSAVGALDIAGGITISLASGSVQNADTEANGAEITFTVADPAPKYTVTFTLTDGTDAIQNASVTIDSKTLTTDASGVATVDLEAGTYTYGVTATGFDAITDGEVVVTDAAVSETVTMTATPAPVSGTITQDPGKTGGEVTVTIADDKATFSGNIDWYPADEALGRAAGNRVGVQITAPADFDTTAAKVTIGETTYNWDDIEDGADYFWWYPLVTEANRTFTATVVWNENSTQVFTVDTTDATLVAAPTYTVTFNSNGGSAVDAISDVAKDAKVTLPTAPTKVGYEFAGWFTEEAFETAFTAETVVTADVTVYAKWTAIPGHVINITTANTLLVGDYAFTLDNANYTLNNYLKSAQTAHQNPAGTFHIYYFTGSAWYDLVADSTLQNPIADLDTINGDGMYQYMNMVDVLAP